MRSQWNLLIDEDGIITFPDDLLEQTGWIEGDVLEWIENNDGSFTLKKLDADS
jgi:bifunctional DNA-binding transcriptional regulator/antitoxin component of YhaV-PrlF toxin-antitoxin module